MLTQRHQKVLHSRAHRWVCGIFYLCVETETVYLSLGSQVEFFMLTGFRKRSSQEEEF